MLEARDLRVVRGGRALLDDVDLEVPDGQVTAVVGPNGAGKTTLLRVLCGELRPDSGEVLLDGTALSAWPSRVRARALAVLPQHSTLAADLRAHEVVELGRLPHAGGGDAPIDRAIARRALSAAGALELADARYGQLSGGERQRVHLARVLAQISERPPRPQRALLLDEPTSSLDPGHQDTTFAAARALARDGVAVLAIVHDVNLAARWADRVVVLANGRVLAAGPPREILTAERFEEIYGVAAVVVSDPRLHAPMLVPAPRGIARRAAIEKG